MQPASSVDLTLEAECAREQAKQTLQLRRLHEAAIPWDVLDRMPDRTIFQTRAWLAYVAETQRATPVVAAVQRGKDTVGYFTGLLIRRFGLPILGSPFPGWTTSYMGFNMLETVPGGQLLAALSTFAFDVLRCVYVEVSDHQRFTEVDAKAAGFESRLSHTYETDLTQSEEQIFARMAKECRQKIRQAERRGVRIEEATDLSFATDFYEQLKDVFSKQASIPTYNVHRVESLIRHLAPTGHLLLLRARGPDKRCIATAIYAGMNRMVEFWGNASFRSDQHLRPNEALHWYAMRYWKRRGLEWINWGRGEYKEKYGVRRVPVLTLSKGRFSGLGYLRNFAQNAFRLKQAVFGRLVQIDRRGKSFLT
jgi:hypothetical protein